MQSCGRQRGRTGWAPKTGVALPLLAALLLAAPAAAEVTAVFAVDLGEPQASQAVADALRQALRRDEPLLLDEPSTRHRLASLGVGVGFTLESLRERMAAAEEAQQDLDVERSIQILESVLQDLESDGDFNAEKQQLHETARVRVATRLLALAGPDEDGSAKTPRGERALAHLREAARTNPTLSLSEKRHPPRLRRLLARAQRDLKDGGLGGLNVDSRPPGATVFVEGRPVGLTPLRLLQQLPRGRYRVWLELDDARSTTRRLTIGDEPASLEVDFSFEGALWADGPGLRPLPDAPLDADVVARAGALVDVERVIVAGVKEGVAFAAQVSVRSATTERRVAVPLAGAALPHTAQALRERLRSGPEAQDPEPPARVLPSGGVHAAPASAAPAAPAALPPGDDDDSALWWWVGGGVGAAVLVTAVAVGAGVTWAALNPPVGRFSVEIVE